MARRLHHRAAVQHGSFVINARGGILGRPLEVLTQPHETADPESFLDSYQHLIDAEVDAVTAGYSCYLPRAHDLMADCGARLLHAATMSSVVERVRNSEGALPIHLTHIDPDQNMARFCEMPIQPTLFGEAPLFYN